MKLLYSPVLTYIMLGVMIFAELTPLRRSALAFACLKRGSSFVMVYWCIICSVFALYASWKSESDMWCENAPVSKRARSQLYCEDLTSLCSSWLFLACLMERSSATCVNLMLSAFWRYLVCEKTGKQACLIQRKVHSINWNVCAQTQHRTDITEQLSSFLGLGNVHTPFSLPADSFHPVQVWTILVLWIKNQVIFLCRHLSTKRLGLIPSSGLSPHFAGNKPFWPAGPWCHQAWRCSRAALCDIPGHLPGPEPFWHGTGWSCREEGCTWPGSPWSPSCIQS